MLKFRDFILNKRTDRASSSILWFHLGNLCISYTFISVGAAIANMPNPNVEGLALLILVYGGLITGNKIANKVLEFKYGKSVSDVESNKPNQGNDTTN